MDGFALSALNWWEQAGVDTFVDETPRAWLASIPPVPNPDVAVDDGPTSRILDRAPPNSVEASAPLVFPPDLASFRTWLLADPAIPGRPSTRLDAHGDPASGTMILLDMPESEDRTARQLLSGEIGQLFDRMLGAMSLDRGSIYLAPFSPARSASGSLDARASIPLAAAARHHIGLVRPRRLLLMGAAPVRALLSADTSEARGRTHRLDLGERSIATIVTFPSRFLLQATSPEDRSARRKTMWEDLQRFMAL